MFRAIKYELNPTAKQKEQIRQTCGCCRLVYNTMLDRKIKAYEYDKINITVFDLINQIPALKLEKVFLKECPAQALQQAVKNKDSAYKAFFNKSG